MSENESSDFTKQLALFERMVRMETKLDTALSRQVDHEGRLRLCEEKLQQANGGWKVLVGVGTAAGAIGGALVKALKI